METIPPGACPGGEHEGNMNRKAGKIILSIIIIGMLGTIFFWGLRSFVENPFAEDSVFQKEGETIFAEEALGDKKETDLYSEESELPIENETENVKRVSELVGLLPDDANTYNIGEAFSQIFFSREKHEEGTVGCRVNYVTFTKDSVDTDAVYYADERIKFDEKYNIENDFTYIVANVTFTNEENYDLMPYINFVRYVAIDPEMQDADAVVCLGELQGYKTSKDLFAYDKSYTKVTIPAGKEFECNLVYIQRDEDIKGKECYLHFNSSGITFPVQEDACYVRLNQNEADI